MHAARAGRVMAFAFWVAPLAWRAAARAETRWACDIAMHFLEVENDGA